MSVVLPISKDNPLILASSSARRKELLSQVGIPFKSIESGIEETVSARLSPETIACQVAMQKAESIHDRYLRRWILGADTIVVLGKRVFGKPRDTLECREMLSSLSGKNHRVITAFCLIDPLGTTLHVEAVATKVKVKEMSEEEIEAYIKTGEPFGKAGGYAIQAIGSFMIERINGSYSNVVGLPLYEVISSMVICGALRSFPLAQE
jgi:septum formation protein